MGLVNGEERQGHLPQPFQEGIGHEPFRGHVEEVQLAAMEPAEHLARLALAQGRVVAGRCHAVFAQGVNLILHEGDEG